MTEQSIETLIKQLGSEDYSLRREAMRYLSRSGEEVIEPLRDALTRGAWPVQVNAAEVLGNIATPRCVYILLETLCDPTLAYECWQALLHIGPPETLARILMECDGVSLTQKREAYRRLSARTGGNPLNFSAEDGASARRAAGQSEMVAAVHLSLPVLIERLGHTDYGVRKKAVHALSVRGAEAREPLCAALKSTHWVVRKNALDALGQRPDVWDDVFCIEAVCDATEDVHLRLNALLLLSNSSGSAALALRVLTDTHFALPQRIAVYNKLRTVRFSLLEGPARGTMAALPDVLAFCERHQEELSEALRREIAAHLTLLRASDAAALDTRSLLRIPTAEPTTEVSKLLRPAEQGPVPDASAPTPRPGLLERWLHRHR